MNTLVGHGGGGGVGVVFGINEYLGDDGVVDGETAVGNAVV